MSFPYTRAAQTAVGRLAVHEQVVELHNCIYGCREEKCTITDYTCCSFYDYFLVC